MNIKNIQKCYERLIKLETKLDIMESENLKSRAVFRNFVFLIFAFEIINILLNFLK